jgi:hypothetical protein
MTGINVSREVGLFGRVTRNIVTGRSEKLVLIPITAVRDQRKADLVPLLDEGDAALFRLAARIGVATSDLYPHILLDRSIGQMSAGSWTCSLATSPLGAFSLPVQDRGMGCLSAGCLASRGQDESAESISIVILYLQKAFLMKFQH